MIFKFFYNIKIATPKKSLILQRSSSFHTRKWSFLCASLSTWEELVGKRNFFVDQQSHLTNEEKLMETREKIVRPICNLTWHAKMTAILLVIDKIAVMETFPKIEYPLFCSKEIQIILRLFLVHYLLLQTKSVSSQPASNVGGLVIHWSGLNWLDST